jgi:hypothetical protein
MTTITTTIARFVALPIVSAGIIGGAALGLAGTAGAATTVNTTITGPSSSVSTTNGNFTAPNTYASPAYNPQPGIQAWREYHRG